MNQIDRIKHMEKILDDSKSVIEEFSVALEKYKEIQPQLQELIEYYESRQWLHDFVDDSLGRIPKELKRGVLSEDAVYDLLSDYSDLMCEIKELLK